VVVIERDFEKELNFEEGLWRGEKSYKRRRR